MNIGGGGGGGGGGPIILDIFSIVLGIFYFIMCNGCAMDIIFRC